MHSLARTLSSTPLPKAAAVYLLLGLAAAQASSPTSVSTTSASSSAALSSSSPTVVSSSPTARSTVSPPVSSTISCDRFRHTGFWDIDIDNRPALPPACGPPLSLHADRNQAHLPVQIVGLFAGYVAFVVAVGVSILTIRRRKSRSELHKASLGLEMVKPEHKIFEISPNSPTPSHLSWMRNPLRKKGSTVASLSSGRSNSSGLNSPISVTNFDQKIVDNDRVSRQAEMERLYAAVMEHDEARRSQLSQVQPPRQPDEQDGANMPHWEFGANTGSSRPTDKRLARVSKLDIPKTPISPVAPQSPIRAIYPPDHEFPFGQPPLSPTSPVTARVPKDWPPPPTPGREPPTPGVEPPTPGGFGPPTPGIEPPTPKRGSLPNQMYPLSPGRTPLPNEMYSISPPPGARQMRLPNEANPASPTGPKAYLPDDMYPASPPAGQRKMSLPFSNAHMYPRSPARADGMQPLSPGPFSPGPLSPGRIDLPNDMYPASPPPMPIAAMSLPSPPVRGPASPRSFISRPGSSSSSVGKGRRILKNMRINTNMKVPDATDYEERTPLSATFKGQNDQYNKNNQGDDGARTPLTAATFDSTVSTDLYESLDQPKPLPLTNPQRQRPNLTLKSTSAPSQPGASQQASGPAPAPFTLPLPSSPYAGSQKSSSSNNALPLRAAGYDNTLTSPAPTKTTFLNRRAENLRRAGLMSAARTPATGMPQTPYSAYMPFTPMTPVTPHLVTRKERRERQRIERAEGRGRGLLDDTDLVREEDESWG